MKTWIDPDSIGPGSVPGIFLAEMALNKYPYSTYYGAVSEASRDEVLSILDHEYKLVHAHLSFDDEDNCNTLYKVEDEEAWFTVAAHNKQWTGQIVSDDPELLGKIRDRILTLLPPIEDRDPGRVFIKFWSLSRQGAMGWMRQLEVAPWEELAVNYPADVRATLSRLIELEPRKDGGKLILWHGPPGTGKTHGIRTLAQAWRKWCNIEYVIDPEKFFGDANYMVQTLVGEERSTAKWRLLVIEDAGEFIREDAAEKTGQGLSRLLNLTDGLIGQGLKLMVLMTTNEKFNDLAASVRRTGRCLSDINFRAFTESEARAWLGEAPKRKEGQTEWVLSDLYGQRNADETIMSPEPSSSGGVYL